MYAIPKNRKFLCESSNWKGFDFQAAERAHPPRRVPGSFWPSRLPALSSLPRRSCCGMSVCESKFTYFSDKYSKHSVMSLQSLMPIDSYQPMRLTKRPPLKRKVVKSSWSAEMSNFEKCSGSEMTICVKPPEEDMVVSAHIRHIVSVIEPLTPLYNYQPSSYSISRCFRPLKERLRE